MNPSLPAVEAAQIIFWVLLPLVLFAPARWGVLVWLVMGNLDTTGPNFTVSTDVGWMNAVKGIVLPLWLCWRLRSVSSDTARALPARLWIALTAYVAIASLWSPFPLAAAKLVGNMTGTLLTFIVLEKAARRGVLSFGGLSVLVIASLVLAGLQTFYYGGAAYGFDGTDQPTRFTSFISAQQFGAFLVAFLAALLWVRRNSSWTDIMLSLVVTFALVLNGSRTWFFGAVLVAVVYFCLSFRRVFAGLLVGAGTLILGFLLILNLVPSGQDLFGGTSSRIVATLKALATGTDTANNLGLANFNFRLAIYSDAIDEIRTADVPLLLFGHGTSSGGNVIMRVFPYLYKLDRLDPNRAIHNEWLRALYEWGILGFVLLSACFLSLVGGLVAHRPHEGSNVRAPAILSFLPAFLLAFTTENVMAGAGNAITMSFALIVALLWSNSVSTERIAVGGTRQLSTMRWARRSAHA